MEPLPRKVSAVNTCRRTTFCFYSAGPAVPFQKSSPSEGGEVSRPRLTLDTSASQRLQSTPCSTICSRLPRRPLKLSGFGGDSQVRSLLQLSPLPPLWKFSVFGQVLASYTFDVRGPSDDPRSLPALGVSSQVQASGCLRNPHGFCRLLSGWQRLYISRVLVATPDDEPALFTQTAGINPRVGVLSMLRFVRLSPNARTP